MSLGLIMQMRHATELQLQRDVGTMPFASLWSYTCLLDFDTGDFCCKRASSCFCLYPSFTTPPAFTLCASAHAHAHAHAQLSCLLSQRHSTLDSRHSTIDSPLSTLHSLLSTRRRVALIQYSCKGSFRLLFCYQICQSSQ
jgi:hypothetical protein